MLDETDIAAKRQLAALAFTLAQQAEQMEREPVARQNAERYRRMLAEGALGEGRRWRDLASGDSGIKRRGR